MSAARRLALLALLSLGLAASARAARWVELAPADTTRPVARASHCVVLDAPGRRLIAWGERIPADEVWALSLDGAAGWIRIRPEGPPPPPRSAASAIFDPVRRRMVVFGGGPGEGTFPTANDTWALTLDGAPRWQQLSTAGPTPDLRDLHTAIYDPVRDRMLVFGGFSTVTPPYGTYENSVWELTLGDAPTWRQLAPGGVAPSPRIGASMVYDAAHDRAIVFGGNNPTEPGTVYTYRNDVFELTLGDAPAWRQLASSGTPPSPRYEQAAVMDDARHQVLVFGGRGLGVTPTSDVWALDVAVDPPVWRKAGPDASFPRYESVAIVDPATDRLLVDGGYCGDYNVGETIALSLAGTARWNALDSGDPPSAPPPRISPVPLVDPATRRLVLEGGGDPATLGAFNRYAIPLVHPDLWTWPLDSASPSWHRVSASVAPFREPGRAVLDPVRRRQFRFFQDPIDAQHTSSVGVMPLDGESRWSPLIVAGAQPQPRDEFSTAYDPVRDRILLVGGYTYSYTGYTRISHRDIWALSLAGTPAWTQLRADDPSGPVLLPDALFFDPGGDRYVAVGYDYPVAGTYALAAEGGTDWTLVAPTTLAYSTVSFDPKARELVAIDLVDGDALHHVLADTVGWVELDVTGEAPPARSTRVEFDPVQRRVLCFGGQGRYGVLGDLWALELDRATPAVALPGPDLVRIEWATNLHSGAAVTVERRAGGSDWAAAAVLQIGADGAVGYRDEAVSPGLAVDYRLRYGGTVLPGSEQHLIVAPRPPLALAGARPNPAVGSAQLVFTLPGATPTRLEVFDLAGRLMETRAVGALGAGEHVIGVDRRLAPGLYVAVLSQAGQRLAKRFVVAR